jgi:restriction system protein
VKAKGSEFIRFLKPILQILKESGGSGTTSEVIDRAIELLRIPESEQEVTLKNGQSRIRNQVQWSRLYLVRAGYLESARRGVWSLTEKGMQADLATFDPYEVFQRRDGAAPIELVAGEDLVKLFETLELGLTPKKTFEIDRRFFDEFSKSG